MPIGLDGALHALADVAVAEPHLLAPQALPMCGPGPFPGRC